MENLSHIPRSGNKLIISFSVYDGDNYIHNLKDAGCLFNRLQKLNMFQEKVYLLILLLFYVFR